VKVDGRAEAMIIALACSKTPNLRRLLAE
jgi:hypothetical protein